MAITETKAVIMRICVVILALTYGNDFNNDDDDDWYHYEMLSSLIINQKYSEKRNLKSGTKIGK